MATISTPTADLMQIAPPHRFSTAEYLEMIEKGVLGPEDKVELIGGVIVEMAPAGIPHNGFLINVVELFTPLIGRFKVAVQGTLTVSEGHVFDPDFMLLRKRRDRYRKKLPDVPDVLLVIEAAESSLPRDQKIKAPVYASAGIADYWIADLKRELLIVHRQPGADRYRSVEKLKGKDIISPLAAPDFSFAVRRLFD